MSERLDQAKIVADVRGATEDCGRTRSWGASRNSPQIQFGMEPANPPRTAFESFQSPLI